MAGEKFSSVCRKAVRMIGIIFVGYLFLQGLFTICCIQRLEEKTFYISNNATVQLLGIVLFALLTFFLCRDTIQSFLRKYGNDIVTIVFAVVMILCIVWICLTQFWFIGDMESVFVSAEELLNGEYRAWQPGGYLYMWPHQNGLLLFIAALRRFFTVGETFTIFYGFNIFFYGVTLLSLIFSLRMLYPEKEKHSVQSIMLLAYFPYSSYCTFMYGNVIGFGFACLSIYLILCFQRKNKPLLLFGAAVAMGLAVCFKQNELIIFIGICCILLFDCFKKQKGGWKNLLPVSVYVLLVCLIMQMPNMMIKQITGIEDLGGNSKWAHIAMGVQESDKAPGWYNCYNQDVFIANNYDHDATGKAALSSFRESMQNFAENPAYAWQFFNYKLASEWNNPTFECFHIQNFRTTALELGPLVKTTINDGGKLNVLLIYLLDIGQSVLLFGILMYLITAKDAGWEQLLFVVLFIGAFVFFAFWEAKCQYVIPFFFLLIPYAYLGYTECIRRIHKPGRERKQMCKVLAAIAVLIVFIAVSDVEWIQDSFKIHVDTQDYYEYIHQYNQNFTNLRF